MATLGRSSSVESVLLVSAAQITSCMLQGGGCVGSGRQALRCCRCWREQGHQYSAVSAGIIVFVLFASTGPTSSLACDFSCPFNFFKTVFMTTFANLLKTEISRIARKEIKSDSKALKQSTSRHRSEIAELKRRITALEAMFKKLSKGLPPSKVEASADGKTSLRFRAAGFASLRKKLAISASDMGKLLGVSAQSVYLWESGKTKPRPSQLQSIAMVRKMGKRTIMAKLSS